MTDAAWPRILADPGLAAVYEAVLAAVGQLGPFEVRYRKSGVQLVRPDGAGVGTLAPGDRDLVLTLAVPEPVTSSRTIAAQQVSDGVWNQRITLDSVEAVDDEVRGWLAVAYRRP